MVRGFANEQPSATAQNRIWAETIRRADMHVPTPKSFTQSLSAITKPIVKDPQHCDWRQEGGSGGVRDFIKTLNEEQRLQYGDILTQMIESKKLPIEKSSMPMTSSQEFGFYRETSKARKSRIEHSKMRKMGAETQFATRFQKLVGQSPFMLHVKRKSDASTASIIQNQASYMDLSEGSVNK